jgi:hypothetical protein
MCAISLVPLPNLKILLYETGSRNVIYSLDCVMFIWCPAVRVLPCCIVKVFIIEVALSRDWKALQRRNPQSHQIHRAQTCYLLREHIPLASMAPNQSAAII